MLRLPQKDNYVSNNINKIDKSTFSHKVYQKWSIKRVLLVVGGIVSFALAIIGIFLPLLPTTPFLLLSATCFARSSERLYNFLINHKRFGPIIRNYREKKAVSLASKIYALILLWVSILSSAFFFVSIIWVKILLLCIASAVTYHILHLKTVR